MIINCSIKVQLAVQINKNQVLNFNKLHFYKHAKKLKLTNKLDFPHTVIQK